MFGGSSSPDVSVPGAAEPSASTIPIVNDGEVAPPTRTLKTTAKASGPAKTVMSADRFRNRRRMSVAATSRTARMARGPGVDGAGSAFTCGRAGPCRSGGGTRPRGRAPGPDDQGDPAGSASLTTALERARHFLHHQRDGRPVGALGGEHRGQVRIRSASVGRVAEHPHLDPGVPLDAGDDCRGTPRPRVGRRR